MELQQKCIFILKLSMALVYGKEIQLPKHGQNMPKHE